MLPKGSLQQHITHSDIKQLGAEPGHSKWQMQLSQITEVLQRSVGCHWSREWALWHENTSCCSAHNVIPSAVGDDCTGNNQSCLIFPVFHLSWLSRSWKTALSLEEATAWIFLLSHCGRWCLSSLPQTVVLFKDHCLSTPCIHFLIFWHSLLLIIMSSHVSWSLWAY